MSKKWLASIPDGRRQTPTADGRHTEVDHRHALQTADIHRQTADTHGRHKLQTQACRGRRQTHSADGRHT